jgi:hypothetical protein
MDSTDGWLGHHIDLWGYESGLPGALDELVAARDSLDAGTWVRNLVPFIAGLFSRGPDLNGGKNNEARIRAFQEMLAPVMVSRWTVLHYRHGDVVTSDRAVAPIDTPVGSGIAVPLDRSSVLLLTRCTERRVATYRDGGWCTPVAHYDMSASDGGPLRNALARFAMSSIVGPSEEAVAIDLMLLGSENAEWPARIVNPMDCDLTCHIYDFFRVASAIRVPPEEAQAAADRIDLEAVLPNWRSPIAVETLFSERTRGGVSVVDGPSVKLNFQLGLDLWSRRRAVGDFRQGAFGIFPFDHVLNLPVPLGQLCHQSGNGRAQRTYLQNLKTGNVTKFDLRPYSDVTRRSKGSGR